MTGLPSERPDPGASWARLTRRRWRTGLATFVPVLVLGAALILLSRPIHRTEAALRLGEPPPPGGISPGGGLLSFFQPGGDAFSNDLELLASRSLAESVVERTALNASLGAPRGWHRDSLLVSLEASRDTEEAVYELAWDDAGRLRVRRTAPTDSVLGVVAPGEAVTLGGVRAVFRPRREGTPEAFSISTLPFAEAVRIVRSAVRVERPRREANVVSLAYDHADPGLAQDVLSAVIGEFVRLRTDLQHRESGETVDSLRNVAVRTADELAMAEEALERVQREGRIVAPDAQSEALVQRQAELLSRLQRARAELAGVDEMLRRLDDVSDPSRSWTALLSYPAFLENQTLGGLLSRLTELHARREELAARRTPENRELRLVEEEIQYLDASLRQVALEYRAGLREQIATLEPDVEALDDYMSGLPARAVELGRRQRDVRLLTEVLVLTEQRLRQEELREALTYANVQVIDPPALRDRPVWPRKKLGLAVVLMMATGTGLLGMVVRERTDPRLRDARDVEDAVRAPVLAVLGRNPDGVAVNSHVARALIGSSAAGGGLVLLAADGQGGGDEEDGGEAGAAAAVADALRRASPNGDGAAGAAPDVRTAGPVRNAGDAAVYAARGVPIAVVIETGRTTSRQASRTVRLIREAGCAVAGVIVVDGAANGRGSWR